MAKVINCQCGATVRGENDDELVENAEVHMNAEHPNLVGKMSRDQLLAMASEAAPRRSRLGADAAGPVRRAPPLLVSRCDLAFASAPGSPSRA